MDVLKSLSRGDVSDQKAAVVAGAVAAVGAYGAYKLLKGKPRVVANGKYKGVPLPADVYDAVCVGAGPSGSTMAYFFAKAGGKIAVLEKEAFPRDKYCGDAVCTPAIRILTEMGVMQELIDNDEAHFADAGGFVSPGGISYIGASKEKLGQAACCAVKRLNLDQRIARCAQRNGANLFEKTEVSNAVFDKAAGLWIVHCSDGRQFKGRVLICADGATSKLATKLGYCKEAPKGVCSRAFVEGGTHNTNFDGVCFYQPESLPGYSAIFKHPKDELNYCYYLIPCGAPGHCGDVTEADLPRLHNDAIKGDPFISRALGPAAKIERMRAAPLRLGSQGVPKTFDDHLLIIGDAAGHIDPLTGEGIHTAIMGGKIAGQVLLDMKAEGDYSAASTRVWEARWFAEFGHDFYLSQKMAVAVWKFPILLDATAMEMQRKGDSMMSKWAEIMTGMQPKTYFLQPHVALPLGVAVLRQFVSAKLLGRGGSYYAPQ